MSAVPRFHAQASRVLQQDEGRRTTGDGLRQLRSERGAVGRLFRPDAVVSAALPRFRQEGMH